MVQTTTISKDGCGGEELPSPRGARLCRLPCGKPSAFRRGGNPLFHLLILLAGQRGKAQPFRKTGGGAAGSDIDSESFREPSLPQPTVSLARSC